MQPDNKHNKINAITKRHENYCKYEVSNWLDKQHTNYIRGNNKVFFSGFWHTMRPWRKAELCVIIVKHWRSFWGDGVEMVIRIMLFKSSFICIYWILFCTVLKEKWLFLILNKTGLASCIIQSFVLSFQLLSSAPTVLWEIERGGGRVEIFLKWIILIVHYWLHNYSSL